MTKITPFLWFNRQAEEAVAFYTSIFPNSKTTRTTYYGESAPLPIGTVLTITFELDGNEFIALNGGPTYSKSPGVSFMISASTQEEIDRYWNSLSEGGQELHCGWLTDRFGVTWQVVPPLLLDLINSSDREKADRAYQAMMQMVKIDIKALQDAYDGLA